MSPPDNQHEGPPTGRGPHEQLRALLQRYGRAADERDIETLSSLFHPEAEMVGARGIQTREEWLDTMRAPRSFPTSMHMIGDPLIEIADTVEEAWLDTYAVVYQLGDPSDGSGDLTLGIRYRDHCVIHGGRWVIVRRLATTLWMR